MVGLHTLDPPLETSPSVNINDISSVVFCRTPALGVWKNISSTGRIRFWYFFQHLLISGQFIPIFRSIFGKNTFFKIISRLFEIWGPSGAQKTSIYFAFYDFHGHFNICKFLAKIWAFLPFFYQKVLKNGKKAHIFAKNQQMLKRPWKS